MPAHVPLLVVLTGPTGSGKSELALRLAGELAADWPVEIISADSAQVYRGLDIGAAKPTAAQRASVPHHLIDLRDPAERYSAGEFVRDAHAAIASIHARGHLPLLVGGTLLYLRALYEGIAAMPPADPAVRAELNAQAREHGWPALHAQLAQIDPAAAERIQPQDAQRIQRALEVHRLTGQPISKWHEAAREQGRGAQTPAGRPYRWLRFALWPPEEPAGRRLLRARLQARWAAMRAAGVLEEVRALHARGDLTEQHPAMRAVGYRQLWQHLEGAISLEQADRAAITATAQLAKRQLTWLRSESGWTRLPMPLQTAEAVGVLEGLRSEILAAAGA